jgi:hypothetical protein
MLGPSILVLVAVGAAAALVAFRIAAGSGRRGAAAILAALRGAALVAIALLIREVLLGWEEKTLETPPEGRPAEVIVLQDGSASMDVTGVPGRSRRDLADSVWTEVRERSGGPGAAAVRRYLFGGNVVEDGTAASPGSDASRLRHALTEVLSRKDLRSLLVVSDGATTDGLAPAYFLDWARNRDIRVSAICPSEPTLPFLDLAVGEAAVDAEVNPASVRARITKMGAVKGPAVATVSVDGKEVGRIERAAEESLDVSFRLPPSEKGWHEYAVRVEPVEGEATDRNNSARGVFRTERWSAVLVQGTPGMEVVQIGRFLVKELGEKILSIPAGRLAEKESALRDASLVILADVPLEKIPETLRKSLAEGDSPVLILGGDSLGGWAGLGLPGFPIARAGAVKFLGRDDGSAPLMAASPETERLDAFRENRIEGPVELVREATVAAKAEVVLGARSGGGVVPVLVADSLSEPHFVVLLAEATWKWALLPRPDARKAYRSLWTALIEWLRKKGGDEQLLVLRARPGSEGEAEVEGWVAPAGRRDGARLEGLRILVDGEARGIEPMPGGEGGRHPFRLRFEARPDGGAVWLQALAELDGKEAASERVPVVLAGISAEFRDVRPAPETLERQTTGEKGTFSWYPDRAGVIDGLFRPEAARSERWKVRKRERGREILLAGAAVLFLALEWWLERRLRAGGRA